MLERLTKQQMSDLRLARGVLIGWLAFFLAVTFKDTFGGGEEARRALEARFVETCVILWCLWGMGVFTRNSLKPNPDE